jgi:two-component system phosphate regulon sensor histidine kinase PhoR
MGRLKDPERQQEALDIIATETIRLSTLITRLLDWARMESGKKSYEFKEERVEPIVDDALRAVNPQRLESGAEVVREVEPSLPPVRVDREAMVDALVDLLQNAFKYTGPTKRIVVGARRVGPTVALSVADNGPGIRGVDQKRIFDKFYRGQDPLERSIEGSGLGLAMVKHVVQAHGGRVGVVSELGKGSTFTILLPASEGT